jgi:hypothetical protein
MRPCPGDHLSVAVYQHRGVEAEGLDTSPDLLDLVWAMKPWICLIELELRNRPLHDLEPADATAQLFLIRRAVSPHPAPLAPELLIIGSTLLDFIARK